MTVIELPDDLAAALKAKAAAQDLKLEDCSGRSPMRPQAAAVTLTVLLQKFAA